MADEPVEKKSKGFPVIILFIVMIVVQAGLSFFILSKKVGPGLNPAEAHETKKKGGGHSASKSGGHGGGHDGGGSGGAASLGVGPIKTIDSMVLNLAALEGGP